MRDARISKILVPVDFSEPSRVALTFAIGLAEQAGAEIEVAHIYQLPRLTAGRLVMSKRGVNQPFAVWKEKQAREQMEQFLVDIIPRAAIPWRVLAGGPADDIVALAALDGFDLIVMATRGRSTVGQLLLGSVAQRVVRLSSVPVLTVRRGQPSG